MTFRMPPQPHLSPGLLFNAPRQTNLSRFLPMDCCKSRIPSRASCVPCRLSRPMALPSSQWLALTLVSTGKHLRENSLRSNLNAPKTYALQRYQPHPPVLTIRQRHSVPLLEAMLTLLRAFLNKQPSVQLVQIFQHSPEMLRISPWPNGWKRNSRGYQ